MAGIGSTGENCKWWSVLFEGKKRNMTEKFYNTDKFAENTVWSQRTQKNGKPGRNEYS